MFKSLILVVVLGAAVGLMIPTGGEDEAPAARAADTARAPLIPVETRIRRSANGHSSSPPR